MGDTCAPSCSPYGSGEDSSPPSTLHNQYLAADYERLNADNAKLHRLIIEMRS